MSIQPFLQYFEQELHHLQTSAREFAKRHKKIARRLDLERGDSNDPHVSRLIQGVAFLNARVRRELEASFPQVSDGILSVLAPHLLAPFPSIAMAKFEIHPSQVSNPSGQRVESGSTVEYSRNPNNTCKFNTSYPVTLWPLVISKALVGVPSSDIKPPKGAVSVLSIELQSTNGSRFDTLSIDSLRFFIDSINPRLARGIYEFIFNRTTHVVAETSNIAGKRSFIDLSLVPVGFRREEGLLDYDERVPLGQRLILEYFAWPSKFLFFDIKGLDQLQTETSNCVIHFFSNKHFQGSADRISKHLFQLGCTPMVNVFRHTQAIRFAATVAEVPFRPKVEKMNSTEVFRVCDIRYKAASIEKHFADEYGYIHLRRLYDIEHPSPLSGKGASDYYQITRRASPRRGDQGTDISLSFTDRALTPRAPLERTLVVEMLCTNRDFAENLPKEERSRHYHLRDTKVGSVSCIMKPSRTLRAGLADKRRWRMISALNLNFFSFSNPSMAAQALREVLRLQVLDAEAPHEFEIEAIKAVHAQPVHARMGSGSTSALVPGVELEIILDSDAFRQSDPYLLLSVIDHTLGMYTALNSFTRLKARYQGSTTMLGSWPMRAGDKWQL